MTSAQIMEVGDLVVLPATGKVLLRGREIEVNTREFALLASSADAPEGAAAAPAGGAPGGPLTRPRSRSPDATRGSP
jgi:hypothetical protein